MDTKTFNLWCLANNGKHNQKCKVYVGMIIERRCSVSKFKNMNLPTCEELCSTLKIPRFAFFFLGEEHSSEISEQSTPLFVLFLPAAGLNVLGERMPEPCSFDLSFFLFLGETYERYITSTSSLEL